MPLTFCHPAIILPLKKLKPNWFSMTGLIVGSMSPDLEYFSRMKIEATHSHLFWGVLYFDLPIALIYCFIFHLFIRNILIQHLPNYFKKRFVSFLDFDWINYFKSHWFIYTNWRLFTFILGCFYARYGIFCTTNSIFKSNLVYLANRNKRL